MGLCSWNSLVLQCCPSPWSSWPDSGVTLGRLSYSTQLGGNIFRSGAMSFWIYSKLVTNIYCYFPHSQFLLVQESKGGDGSGSSLCNILWSINKCFAIYLHHFRLSWSRSLISRGRSVSNRQHLNGIIKLEVETTTWPLWAPHANESRGKEGGY